MRECEVLAIADDGGVREKRLVAFVVPAEGDERSQCDRVASGAEEQTAGLHDAVGDRDVGRDAVDVEREGGQEKVIGGGKGKPRADDRVMSRRARRSKRSSRSIWQQVLKVERVGVHDNFFELGGDSVLSIQVAARANQANLHFTTKQLFMHQTIAELATVVVEKGANEAYGGRSKLKLLRARNRMEKLTRLRTFRSPT